MAAYAAAPRWLPWIEAGDTLYSVFVLHKRATGLPAKLVYRAVYGEDQRVRNPGSGSSPLNLFGANATEVAERVFSGRLSAKDTLRAHTLTGYYANCAADWQVPALFRQAESGRAGMWVSRGLSEPASPTGGLRYCPLCASEQLESQGYATWRVQHQIPIVGICHQHRCKLVSCCPGCGSPYDLGCRMRLPGDRCSSCGAASQFRPEEIVPSEQCKSVYDTIEKLTNEGMPDLVAPRWNAVVDKVIERFGGWETAVASVQRAIDARWDQSESSHKVWGRKVDLKPVLVERELSLGSSLCSLDRILVYDAIHASHPDVLAHALKEVTASRCH